MPFWLRRASLGWGRSGSKHLMHHPRARHSRQDAGGRIRGYRADGERASAQRSGWYPLLHASTSQGLKILNIHVRNRNATTPARSTTRARRTAAAEGAHGALMSSITLAKLSSNQRFHLCLVPNLSLRPHPLAYSFHALDRSSPTGTWPGKPLFRARSHS